MNTNYTLTLFGLVLYGIGMIFNSWKISTIGVLIIALG